MLDLSVLYALHTVSQMSISSLAILVLRLVKLPGFRSSYAVLSRFSLEHVLDKLPVFDIEHFFWPSIE